MIVLSLVPETVYFRLLELASRPVLWLIIAIPLLCLVFSNLVNILHRNSKQRAKVQGEGGGGGGGGGVEEDLPPMLAYNLPVIGHAVWLVMNYNNFVNAGRSQFGPFSPFTINLMGKKLFIFNHPSDIAALLRGSADSLSFDPFLQWSLQKICGISSAGVAHIWASGMIEDIHALTRKFLTSGEHLEDVSRRFVDSLSHLLRVRFESTLDPSTNSIFDDSDPESGAYAEVPCYDWTRMTMAIASTNAFFGRRLLDRHDSVVKLFYGFDSEFHKALLGMPKWMAPKMHERRDTLIGIYEAFIASINDENREELAEFLRCNIDIMQKGETTVRDTAAHIFGITTAFNLNTGLLSFWLLAHLLKDSELLADIREETSQAFSTTDSGTLDIPKLLSSSPILDSFYHEVLRHYSNTPIVRVAMKPTRLTSYTLPAASVIVAPTHEHNLSPTLWGPTASVFNPRRFIKRPDLERTPGFKPFGGGKTLCPGRFLAKREVFTFIAEMLRGFECELVGDLPDVSTTKVSSGVLTPEACEGLRLRLRRR